MLIGLRYGGHFPHARTLRDQVRDLVRIHLEARDDDHVLLAILDEYEAALIEAPDIPGTQPAFRQHDLVGLLGPLPVAAHHLRAAQADLPDRADRQGAGLVLAGRELG